MVLPLHKTGQITVGNALMLDWLAICPPMTKATLTKHDLAESRGRLTPEEQSKVETYICGNPPYKGSQDQTANQKRELQVVFAKGMMAGSSDYVLGWFAKAGVYARSTNATFAFVATNSVHQGRQVARFWPHLLLSDLEIFFADRSFKWTNLAAKRAVVTVSVIGVARVGERKKVVFDMGLARQADYIGPYLLPNVSAIVQESREVRSNLHQMLFGSMPNDGGGLLLSFSEAQTLARRIAGRLKNLFIGSRARKSS